MIGFVKIPESDTSRTMMALREVISIAGWTQVMNPDSGEWWWHPDHINENGVPDWIRIYEVIRMLRDEMESDDAR